DRTITVCVAGLALGRSCAGHDLAYREHEILSGFKPEGDGRRRKFFARQKLEQFILGAFEKHEHGLDVFAQLALWARQALTNSHEIRTHVGQLIIITFKRVEPFDVALRQPESSRLTRPHRSQLAAAKSWILADLNIRSGVFDLLQR